MAKVYPFNPKTELFRWGPAPMRCFYQLGTVKGVFGSAALYGEVWPLSLMMFIDGKGYWVNDMAELEKRGQRLFNQMLVGSSTRNRARNSFDKTVRRLYLLENKIAAIDISSFSNVDFVELWETLFKAIEEFWSHGIVPEFMNYAGESKLRKMLEFLLKDEQIVLGLMEALTAPENPSFYQVEEMDLFSTSNIEEHANKYFWLKNNYSSTHVLKTDFFEERKKHIADVRLELEERQKEIKKKKAGIISKYNLSPEIVTTAETIVDSLEWQDDRKREIWKYLYFTNAFLEELSRRFGWSKENLLNYTGEEVTEILINQSLPNDFGNRRHGFGFLLSEEGQDVLSSEEVRRLWKMYESGTAGVQAESFSGTVVSSGAKVKGVVKIILDPLEHFDPIQNMILVAPMTTPEYIFAMKNAVAVITDTGGLTSHAAVVSRELGIPCIVGTKIATKVLKDGDMVEVDATKGLVKIIK